MNEYAIESNETKPDTAARPGFGILLSLLAIGMTLNVVRAASLLVNTQPEAPEEWNLLALESVWCGLNVVPLVLLLRRRRVFIPAMSALLVLNILINLGTYVWMLSSGYELEGGNLHVLTFVGVAIACLWLAYLWRSKRVREVCAN